jgi:nucleotide-binding universal stress UspA family protein
MLRSILVALDATEASTVAQSVAISLAKAHDCRITGIAILDRAYITAPTAVGIGGTAFKQHRDQVKLEEAKAFLDRLERGFESSCEALGGRCQVIEAEGVPHRMIEHESVRHDLLVIGKDTDFHFDAFPSIASMVQRLLDDNARPLIVCPETPPREGPVLVTYDGSVRSSRALHMLALLGLARDRPVHLLAIAEEQALATERAERAAELLAKHGHQVTQHAIRSHAQPSDIIGAEAATLGVSMIAMATSGHRPLHDLFIGSNTQRLLRQCPCPLFVHH